MAWQQNPDAWGAPSNPAGYSATPNPNYQAYPAGYSANPNPNYQATPAGSSADSYSANPSYAANQSYSANPNQAPCYAPQSSAPAQNQMLNQEVGYASPSVTSQLLKIGTRSQAKKAALRCKGSVQEFSDVLRSYLIAKRANISSRLMRPALNLEYAYSTPDVRMYNHLMHKLEKLSADVIISDARARAPWIAALNPFRQTLFEELCKANQLADAFSGGIPGGRFSLPDLDDWALGVNARKWMPPRGSGTVRKGGSYAPRELLGGVHTVILIDDSGSMQQMGHASWGGRFGSDFVGGGGTRWQQVRTLIQQIAPVVTQFDPQGIDIHFLNHINFSQGIRDAKEVERVFNSVGLPNGFTPTGQRVNDILDGYLSTLRYARKLRPLNLLVLTDGEANDEEILHAVLEDHVTHVVSRGYVAHQLGIEFIQVGDDAEATRHLERLEEEVSRHHRRFSRDVVGVTPTNRLGRMDQETLIAIMVSGIDARMNGYLRQRRVNV